MSDSVRDLTLWYCSQSAHIAAVLQAVQEDRPDLQHICAGMLRKALVPGSLRHELASALLNAGVPLHPALAEVIGSLDASSGCQTPTLQAGRAAIPLVAKGLGTVGTVVRLGITDGTVQGLATASVLEPWAGGITKVVNHVARLGASPERWLLTVFTMTGDEIRELTVSEKDSSFELGLALALVSRATGTHVPCDIVATGGVDPDGTVTEVDVVDLEHKLRAGWREYGFARRFLVPDSQVATARQVCKANGWELEVVGAKNVEAAVLRVWPEITLGAADSHRGVSDSDGSLERETTPAAGRKRRSRALAVAAAAAVCAISGAGWVLLSSRSQLLPPPKPFATNEFGVLVESRPFDPNVDTGRAFNELSARLQDWRDDAVATMAHSDFRPQIRLATADRVTPELLLERSGTLGIHGAIEWRQSAASSDYYLRNSTVYVNLRRTADMVGAGCTYAEASYIPDRVVTYLPHRMRVYSSVLCQTAPSASQGTFAEHYSPVVTMSQMLNGVPLPNVNLNYSIEEEFAALRDTAVLRAPLPSPEMKSLPMEDINTYVSPVFSLAVLLRQTFGPDVRLDEQLRALAKVDDRVADLKSWPSPLAAVYLRTSAEALSYLAFLAPHVAALPNASLSDAALSMLSDHSWVDSVEKYYLEALHRDPRVCGGCLESIAQLRLYFGDTGALQSALTRDSSATLDRKDRARLIHLRAKTQALAESRRERGSPNPTASRSLEALWDDLGMLGYPELGHFERARWLAALQYSQGHTHEDELRAVLAVRPRHVATRFLLALALLQKGGTEAVKVSLQLLAAIAQDLQDAHFAYDPDLHSLDDIDTVRYSVRPRDLVLVLLAAAIAGCDPAAQPKADSLLSFLSSQEREQVAAALRPPRFAAVLTVFPMDGFRSWTSQPYEATCPGYTDILASAVQRVTSQSR